MIEKAVNIKFFRVLLFIFSFMLFAGNNQNVSIYILDEAKNASCAREMMETGKWDYPTFNYELRSDKPPLHYFFMIASYKVFGVNAWAARFFSAVFGALTILIVFHFTCRFSNKILALWSVIILLASVHFQLQHHLAVPDPYLLFFVTCSIFLFYSFINTNKPVQKYLMYSALALGFLSKGPVAVAIPVLIFTFFLILTKRLNFSIIKALNPLAGITIIMLIAAPWFIAVHFSTDGEWTRNFFLEHNLNRYTSEFEGHGGTFLLTLVYVFIGMLPFSIYLYHAVRFSLNEKKDDWVLLSAISVMVVVIFFCFSQTRLPNYTVLAYPFISLIIASYFSYSKENEKSDFISVFVFFIIILLSFPAAYIAMGYDPVLKQLRYIMLWTIVLPAGIMISLFLIKKGLLKYARLNLALTGLVTGLIFFYAIYPAIDRRNPVALSKHKLVGKEVVFLNRFNPAFAFELKKPIPEINRNKIKEYFKHNPNGIIISDKKSFQEYDFPEWFGIVFEQKDVFEIPTTVLIAPFENK